MLIRILTIGLSLLTLLNASWAFGEQISLDVTLAKNRKSIIGTATIQVTNTTSGALDQVPLWLYPNRFHKPDPRLDSAMIKWIHPTGGDPGSIEISDVQWNNNPLPSQSISYRDPLSQEDAGDQNTLAMVRLPRPLLAGEVGVLQVSFVTKIPRKRGRFGHYRGVISLAGGWFPRPAADLTTRDLTRPHGDIDLNLKLTVPKKLGVVAGDTPFPPMARAQNVQITAPQTSSVNLFFMKTMSVYKETFDWGKVTLVTPHYHQKAPTWSSTRTPQGTLPEGLDPIATPDKPARILRVVDDTMVIAKNLGLAPKPHADITIVELPVWDQLVQPGPGLILISDKAYDVIPTKRAQIFHDRALVRALGFEIALTRKLQPQDTDLRFMLADTLGSYLAALYVLHKQHKNLTVAEAINFASFLPEIDDFIYAPQGPFREVYSDMPDDPLVLRDETWLFMNQLPRGRRILYKLQDLMGAEATGKLIAQLYSGDQAFDELLRLKLDEDVSWFFDQWLGPYPQVNYRLGVLSSEPQPSGFFKHTVEIIREGASIREPVAVHLTDSDGNEQDVVWDGRTQKGIVTWTSQATLERAFIDPKHRLIESAAMTEDHPLFDNSNVTEWRPPQLMQFYFWGEAATLQPHIDITLGFKRKYDLSNTFYLHGYYNPRGYGGKVSYRRSFGPKRTMNARRWYFGPDLAGSRWFSEDIVGVADPVLENAATTGNISLVLGRDSRVYPQDPMKGSAFYTAVTYIGGATDDLDLVSAFKFNSRAFLLLSPGVHHTFAMYGGFSVLLGQPVASNLVTLSDRQILRGFDLNETYGRLGVYAVAEYRHTIVNFSNLDIIALAWLDRLQGALFLGGGTVTNPENFQDMFTKERLFSEVGYGLRLHLLVTGAIQWLLALDVAVPLTPTNRTYEATNSEGDTVLYKRAPLKFILGISQTF